MIVKSYRPASPTIEAFHKCDAPARALVGAVGTGKTVAALWEIAFNLPRRCYDWYGITHTRWFIVRKAYTWLMDTDLATAEAWFPHHDWLGVKKQMTVVWPASENCPVPLTVELLFRAGETDEDEQKFRSTEVTGAWIDESIELRQMVKLVIISRLGRFPAVADTPAHYTPRYLIETTNPCPVDHIMYWQYKWMGPKLNDDGTFDTDVLVPHLPPGPIPMRAPTPGFIGFWQQPKENVENVRAGYWDDIKAMYPESPEMQAMLADGKPGYRPEGKGVYRNYDRDVHMATDELVWMQVPDTVHGGTKGAPLIMGWDNSGDAPACVLIQRVAPMQFQVLREYYDDRMGIIDFTASVLEQLQTEFPGAEVAHYCDPAGFARYSDRGGGLTSNALLQQEQFGLRLNPSRQELDLRVSAVDQLLARRNGILIDPRCIRLLNGFFGGYVREENPRMGMSEFKELPKKNKFSHVHDALQYALVPIIYPLIKEPRGDIKTMEQMEANVIRMSDGTMIPRAVKSRRRTYATFDPRR